MISVPDFLKISQFHELFLVMLDRRADPDFIFRVHEQTFASFRRRYRDTRPDDFRLRSQEKFQYVCDTLDPWEGEANGREPYGYLCWLLERLPGASTATELDALLPWAGTRTTHAPLSRASARPGAATPRP